MAKLLGKKVVRMLCRASSARGANALLGFRIDHRHGHSPTSPVNPMPPHLVKPLGLTEPCSTKACVGTV